MLAYGCSHTAVFSPKGGGVGVCVGVGRGLAFLLLCRFLDLSCLVLCVILLYVACFTAVMPLRLSF